MNKPFSGSVESAASVATSGRWDALNESVKQWAARGGSKDELWYGQLFAGLCFRVFSEYLALKQAYAEGSAKDDISLLSWRVRNLLELSVWANFCAKDRDSAWQFFKDLGRDANGVLNAFKKWGEATGQSPDWFQPGAEACDEPSNRAAARGVDSIDGRFTDVKKAAAEIGIGDHFNLAYKILSKLAHPTAMLILSSSEFKQMQRTWVFGNGCLFFMGAFTALEVFARRVALAPVPEGP
jgi:hypothetical protein